MDSPPDVGVSFGRGGVENARGGRAPDGQVSELFRPPSRTLLLPFLQPPYALLLTLLLALLRLMPLLPL